MGTKERWKHIHTSQSRKRERSNAGGLPPPLKYIPKWLPQRVKRLRATFWRNRGFWVFDPLDQGGQNPNGISPLGPHSTGFYQ